MTKTNLVFILLLKLLVDTTAFAHPGSGIAIDKFGQIYFTDTGKGVWKIDTHGKLIYMPASEFHWMTIDPDGYFAESQKSFGMYFERVTSKSSKPALIICSDFPLVVNFDGNIYYANTRSNSGKIIRRSPEGKESELTSNRIFEFTNGITSGKDGSLYITESSNANFNTIRKITMYGTVSIIATFVGESASKPPLETVHSYCRGLSIDSLDNLYVAATGSRSVLKITPQGKVITLLQESSPWTPTGVVVARGEVYVLEWHDVTSEKMEIRSAWIPRIRKIGVNGKVTTLATVSRN